MPCASYSDVYLYAIMRNKKHNETILFNYVCSASKNMLISLNSKMCDRFVVFVMMRIFLS